MRIRRVLVPVDFSPPWRLAVNYGVAVARQFHATLALLHVVQIPAVSAYSFPTRESFARTVDSGCDAMIGYSFAA